jgi:hypothetical protein
MVFEKWKDGGVETQNFDLRASAEEARTARNPRLSNKKTAELNGFDPRTLVMDNVGQSNGTRIVAAFVLDTVLMILIMRNPLNSV